jgi:hypothetical protein
MSHRWMQASPAWTIARIGGALLALSAVAVITIGFALMATPAIAVASPPVKFSISGTGVACVMDSTSVQCQGANSAVTFSATVTPDGQVATCRQVQGASPGCVLWPGASYKDVFPELPEPLVGPFACIPLGLWDHAKGAVCTVVSSGKGFRITAGKVVKVAQISTVHPPCTRRALTAALERAQHRRSLAPSFLSRGWRCAGNYAWGDYIAVDGPGTGDDITIVFRGKGRRWQTVGRGTVCEDGELPARIYRACTVN